MMFEHFWLGIQMLMCLCLALAMLFCVLGILIMIRGAFSALIDKW